MGADGPKAAGLEQTNEHLANALGVESEFLPETCQALVEAEEYELAGRLHLLMIDLPEVVRRLRGAPEGAGEPDAWIVRAWEPRWGWQEQLCATEDDADEWVKWYSEHETCDAFPPEKVHKVPLYARRLRTGREERDDG